MEINGYVLKGELKNANSGFSKWGFAIKNGKEYFIKELIHPVYPLDSTIMSAEQFRKTRDDCLTFERRFQAYFKRINEASRGNLVRVVDFFRCDSRYYIITEKVNNDYPYIANIARVSSKKKLLLLKTAAQCFSDLHSTGIVHFDVKPSNILIKKTRTGNLSAKLIDFDSGFFTEEILHPDEIGGDLAYLAPETFLAMIGEDAHPNEKADIFGLGLLFCEYCYGKLPDFDAAEYDYPYEVVLDGGKLEIDPRLDPDGVADLILSMLHVDPEQRPSAQEIIVEIDALSETGRPIYSPVSAAPEIKTSTEPGTASWFYSAGDL